MIIDIVLDRVSIHALLAECDDLADINTFLERVSIHALLAECDVLHPPLLSDARSFNPRTPCGVRRQPPDNKETIESFNPRTPCGVRLLLDSSPGKACIVSIHALLAECDQWTMATSRRPTSFNPRTPCGVRLRGSICLSVEFQFQSTHSLRSATDRIEIKQISFLVSIHALLAECDAGNMAETFLYEVSIHALLAECDRVCRLSLYIGTGFQSTHSLRSATKH